MPTDAEQLATIKSQILANLVAITEDPKPTYNVDGQMVDWTEYMRMLHEQLKIVNAQINAEAPTEYHSRGFS
jgi:hypothetical protein